MRKLKAKQEQVSPTDRRGRPSKSSQRQILELGGEPISREFRFRPLRRPVDVQFQPYYERILNSDLSAIGDYVDRNAARRHLDPSFYELLGRLATIRFYAAADRVLADIEWRGNIGSVTNTQAYAYWYRVLLPLCQRARQFIREAHASSPNATRAQLWRDYVFQPFPSIRYALLAELTAKKMLQGQADGRDQRLRNEAVEDLLAWAEDHTVQSARSYLSGLGCHGKELEALTESKFHLENTNKFSPFHLVSHAVFSDLALTRTERERRHFLLTPATVARRYAAKIVRVSESWASRRNVCK